MEKIVTAAASNLSESVLGAAVILLVLLVLWLAKIVFSYLSDSHKRTLKHIEESDKRWSETVKKSTDALQKNTMALHEISERTERMGDRIGQALEKGLRDSSRGRSSNNV